MKKKPNNNIEQNGDNSEINQNNISFDEEEYFSGLSEVDERKVEQKEIDKSKVEELKQNLDDELLSEENKKLILDIIGEEELTKREIEYLGLDSLTKAELERIKENKNIILEATGQDKIDVDDLYSLTKINKEDLNKVKENKDLILKITGMKNINIGNLGNLSKLTKEELEKIKENKSLIFESTGEEGIYEYQLSYLRMLDKEDLEKVKKNKDLILKITGMENINIGDLCELSELTEEELQKIEENKKLILEILGKKNLNVSRGKELSKLTKQELKHIKKICEGEMVDIEKIVTIGKLIKNINKDFIKRKINYLLECRKNDSQLINDSEFEELFGKEGKFGKGEINQGKLGYCYFYTVCEMLKKTNYFNILIKTNLRKSKTGEGWDIRLPMGHADGQWIPVSKNEIDKTFDVPNKKVGLKKGVSVNSDTQLGFKIIEIGFIKKALMSLDKDIEKEFLDSGDIKLTGEKIAMLEGDALVTALNLSKYGRNQNYFVLETLIGKEHFDGGCNILFYEGDENLIFNCFNLGLLVDTSVKTSEIKDAEIKMDVDGKITDSILLRDVKIINKDENISEIKPGVIKNKDGIFERIPREKRIKEMLLDLVIDENGQGVVFSRGHAYSVERCYVDKSGNKRVWVVNSYHTGIKFDMSFENAKKIFDWEVSFIDTDKLFR